MIPHPGTIEVTHEEFGADFLPADTADGRDYLHNVTGIRYRVLALVGVMDFCEPGPSARYFLEPV